MPAASARRLTIHQTSFSLILGPQTVPVRRARLKTAPFCDGSRGHPPIQSVLDPIGNRHRADVSSFAIAIDDGPVLIPLLQVPQGEARSLCPA